MEIIEFLLFIAIGIFLIVIGIMNTRGNVSMLHAYHRKRVREEDMLPFGRTVGIGMMLIGVAMIVAGILRKLASVIENGAFATAGDVVLICGFVIGFGITFFAMFKYNKGIF